MPGQLPTFILHGRMKRNLCDGDIRLTTPLINSTNTKRRTAMCPVPPDTMQWDTEHHLGSILHKNVELESDWTLRFNYHSAEIPETEDCR